MSQEQRTFALKTTETKSLDVDQGLVRILEAFERTPPSGVRFKWD